MNEWDLANILTEKWAESGLFIDDKRHILVGWEIMLTDPWKINDRWHEWTTPSLDFLVADENMRLTVIELKIKIAGIKPAWQVLCQVTHRAAKLSRTLTWKNIECAFLNCWGLNYGRVDNSKPLKLPDHCETFADYHRHRFGALKAAPQIVPCIRRCVAACEFGGAWPAVLQEFNAMPHDKLKYRVAEELTSKQASRERDRFQNLETQDWRGIDGLVLAIRVEP